MLGCIILNPLKHIDPIGTVLVPLGMFALTGFMFGWAKPVPVDARNLKRPHRDMAWVAVAGPAANLLMAVFWGLAGHNGISVVASPRQNVRRRAFRPSGLRRSGPVG